MNHLKGAEIEDIFSVMEIHLVLSKIAKQVEQSYNRVIVMS